MYKFKTQFRKGQKAEKFLDSIFADDFYIQEVSRDQERRGIDRVFTQKTTGKRYTIQYKADKTAARTGNAFIETVSVDVEDVPGWAYTCEATFILYYIDNVGPVYILRPQDIRRSVAGWQAQYGSRSIPNKNNGRRYNTIGVLVPLRVLEGIAVRVVNI